jgi:RimJ/RimL family protein N-acetyltransferase
VLSGQRVGLRALARDDLPQLLTWRNAPELRRFFRERRELGMQDQVAWFERVTGQGDKSRDAIMFAIQTLDEGELVGVCGLCYVDWTSGTAELSIYIGADLVYVDRVLAPDACRVLVAHAFMDLGLRRLWTEVYSFDTGKRALLEALGFAHEGRLREHRFHAGAHHDSLLFGLLRDEWRP